MAEQEFTEAGQFGKKLRSGLASAYKAAKGGAKWGYDYINDFVTEYGQEPLLNLYPQAVNLTAAAGEAIAGVADKPVNLGRYPYYNLQTQFDEELEPPEPKATLENRDLLSEYYGGVDNVPLRKAEAVKPRDSVKKIYRVMFAGKGAEASQTYETKEEADAALKKAGGKGAVAGINFSQQQKPRTKAKVFNRNYLMGRLGEELPAKETEARKKAYLDKDAQAYANKTMYDDSLKRAKSPEYKAAVQERSRLANEAKRAKDKEAGAGFASWRSDVKARRGSEDTLNRYNQSIGLLKQAYTQARRSGNFEKAFDISERIQKEEADVPREMGARKKYFEESAIRDRNAMLAEQERLAKLKSVNPDS